MPRRPPKRWFYRCVRRVKEEAPEVKNPQALCGWIWHHHAKPSTKRKILATENPKSIRVVKLMLKAVKSPKTPKHLREALKKKLKEMGVKI
jgi:hypothetical protein